MINQLKVTQWDGVVILQENDLLSLFLDYYNNYLTVAPFANDYGLNITDASLIINKGREINNTKG